MTGQCDSGQCDRGQYVTGVNVTVVNVRSKGFFQFEIIINALLSSF